MEEKTYLKFTYLVRYYLIPGTSSTLILCGLSQLVPCLASSEMFPQLLGRRNANAYKRKTAKYYLPKAVSILRIGLL